MAQRQTTEQIVRKAIHDELTNGMKLLIKQCIHEQAEICSKHWSVLDIAVAKLEARQGVWYPLLASAVSSVIVGGALLVLRYGLLR